MICNEGKQWLFDIVVTKHPKERSFSSFYISYLDISTHRRDVPLSVELGGMSVAS